jgi:hypothetical protein
MSSNIHASLCLSMANERLIPIARLRPRVKDG